MDWNYWKLESLDYIKGFAAAVLVAGATAGLQYIGAHIPELLSYLAQFAAATSTIKLTKN